MIPNWAKLGAKVVCVDDRVHPAPSWVVWSTEAIPLVKGERYTLGEISVHNGFLLACINEVPLRGDDDFGYKLSRFRPLITQSDDIALFTHLLETTSEDQLIKEEA